MFASRSEAVARANASIATGLKILFAGASQLPSTQARLVALAVREQWKDRYRSSDRRLASGNGPASALRAGMALAADKAS